MGSGVLSSRTILLSHAFSKREIDSWGGVGAKNSPILQWLVALQSYLPKSYVLVFTFSH